VAARKTVLVALENCPGWLQLVTNAMHSAVIVHPAALLSKTRVTLETLRAEFLGHRFGNMPAWTARPSTKPYYCISKMAALPILFPAVVLKFISRAIASATSV